MQEKTLERQVLIYLLPLQTHGTQVRRVLEKVGETTNSEEEALNEGEEILEET